MGDLSEKTKKITGKLPSGTDYELYAPSDKEECWFATAMVQKYTIGGAGKTPEEALQELQQAIYMLQTLHKIVETGSD